MDYLTLVKTLISAVKTVETLMPNSPGKDKFNVAVELVGSVMGDVAPILPELGALATLLVEGFRAVGVFVKKEAAQVKAM